MKGAGGRREAGSEASLSSVGKRFFSTPHQLMSSSTPGKAGDLTCQQTTLLVELHPSLHVHAKSSLSSVAAQVANVGSGILHTNVIPICHMIYRVRRACRRVSDKATVCVSRVATSHVVLDDYSRHDSRDARALMSSYGLLS